MCVLAVSVAATFVLRGPIGKALARWIESWGAGEVEMLGGGSAQRLNEFEHRLADLEARETRLVELEERLDFAERLLAREAGARQLPGAGA